MVAKCQTYQASDAGLLACPGRCIQQIKEVIVSGLQLQLHFMWRQNLDAVVALHLQVRVNVFRRSSTKHFHHQNTGLVYSGADGTWIIGRVPFLGRVFVSYTSSDGECGESRSRQGGAIRQQQQRLTVWRKHSPRGWQDHAF